MMRLVVLLLMILLTRMILIIVKNDALAFEMKLVNCSSFNRPIVQSLFDGQLNEFYELACVEGWGDEVSSSEK